MSAKSKGAVKGMSFVFPTTLVHSGFDILGNGGFGKNGSYNVFQRTGGNGRCSHPTVRYDSEQPLASLPDDLAAYGPHTVSDKHLHTG
jgi:hypothetical protein